MFKRQVVICNAIVNLRSHKCIYCCLVVKWLEFFVRILCQCAVKINYIVKLVPFLKATQAAVQATN